MPLLCRPREALPARLQRVARRGRHAPSRRRHLLATDASPRAAASGTGDPHLPAPVDGAGMTRLVRVLPAVFLAAVGLTALRPIDDADFWWLLRAGRYMVETGSFLRADPFSATASGAAWLNHAWGFELFIYGIYALGGTTGVILLQ